MYFDYWMLYVGYVLKKLVDVISGIDDVLTSDRSMHVRSRSAFYIVII